MITYASEKDLSKIIDLWNECFPNEQEFTEYFFENIYQEKNTIIIKKDDDIVAMLQMLPFCSSQGEVTYIYGVATAIKHRKMGYAERLMNKSFEISRERGHEFSVLIPAEAWLFDFYKKYGYETRFFYKNDEMLNENVQNIAQKLNACDFDSVMNIYSQAPKGEFFIKRDREYFLHQLDLYGDGAMKYIEQGTIIGYSFGYFKDEKYIIDEIFSNDLQKCLKSFEKVNYKTYGNEKPIGVIKSLGDKKLPQDGYFNLMYN